MAENRRNIVAHHSLRGIAALLVVFYHMKDISHDKGAAIDSMTGFFSKGYIWVDMFFILSGFILSFVYMQSMASSPYSFIKQKEFIISRVSRIYPLHLATLVSLVVINGLSYYLLDLESFFNERKSIESLSTNIFLLHGWGFHETNTWNIPSWSISAEMFAYIIFPVLIVSYSKSSLLANIVYFLISVAMYVFIFINYENVEGGADTNILRCMSGFLLGMVMFNVYDKVGSGSVVLVSIMQVVAVIGLFVVLHYNYHDSLTILCFVILIYFTSDNKGVLFPVMSLRPLVYLGTLSYSIYLVHWLVYEIYWLYGKFIFTYLASMYSPFNVTALKYSLFFITSLILSFLSYKYIEMPAQKYIRSKRKK